MAQPSGGIRQVVNDLVAVHSTDPATVFMSMWARVPGFRVSELEDLLYDKRSLVRHWAMRRTLWVVDREMLPVIVESSTRLIGERERSRTARIIEEGGVAEDGEAWLQMAIPKTLEAISAHGEVLTRQLSRDIPELGDKIVFTNKAGRIMGSTGTASRVLVQLGLESQVVRTRPAGSWISGQYRWAVLEEWLGPMEKMSPQEASAALVESWLASYGPGTEADIRWWTGWTARQVRQALADVGAVEVDLGEDGSGYVLANDIEDVAEPEPWVAILPSLDTTTMGWKEREWYLGDHYPTLFDSNGNAGPTVWVDGQVVGGWAQRPDGQVVYGLIDDVGSEAVAAIEARVEELEEWLGDVNVTPRFRSPHVIALCS